MSQESANCNSNEELVRLVRLLHTTDIPVRLRRGSVLAAYVLLQSGIRLDENDVRAFSEFEKSQPLTVRVHVNFGAMKKGIRCHAIIMTSPVDDGAYNAAELTALYNSALPKFLESVANFIGTFGSKIDESGLKIRFDLGNALDISKAITELPERAVVGPSWKAVLDAGRDATAQKAPKQQPQQSQRPPPPPIPHQQREEEGIMARYHAAISGEPNSGQSRQSFADVNLDRLVLMKHNNIEGYMYSAQLPLNVQDNARKRSGHKIDITKEDGLEVERLIYGKNLMFVYSYPSYVTAAEEGGFIYFEVKSNVRSQVEDDPRLLESRRSILEVVTELANGPLARHINMAALRRMTAKNDGQAAQPHQ